MRNLGINNLDIYVTGRCNYRCEYCYGEGEYTPDMAVGTYSKALEFASFIGAKNIQMCGGEPLLCKNFKDFTSMARKAGFEVILRTNGFYLDKCLEFVAENCCWVGVSIDGVINVNDVMRPSKNNVTAEEKFIRPINGIRNLKKINPNIKIILATLASKVNYTDIPKFASYIQDIQLPIDKWKIYEFIRDKFRSDINYQKYEMTQEEFDYLIGMVPRELNGADVILQSAHTERVGANCLIVYQNGDINLSGIHYGNINCDRFDVIVERLSADDVLAVIRNNKKETYGDEK